MHAQEDSRGEASTSERVKDIFHETLALPPAERGSHLDRACGGDPVLCRQVGSLLAAHVDAGTFMERELTPAPGTTPASATESWSGGRPGDAEAMPERIGEYRIVREIGRGGIGVVYVGVREDDRFRRTAAIKVLKHGMDTDEILDRFELERQVLSALNHPNIARLLDGGMTGDGRPYFALEYIEGEPIDAYCDSHRLTTSERLELFTHVCRAVHYAHQNLVVHRDIKPGNILVTKDGVPKLLDFGIVKLLNPDLTAVAAEPTGRMTLMTPEYGSPEQVSCRPITTASDVYSLGVVLYELLSGHRPYRLNRRIFAELIRAICEEDPERPSTAASRIDDVPVLPALPEGTGLTRQITPESVSRTREGRVDRLRRRLRGDIDNIVMKALRKAPQRRYASAEAFADDIERHLRGYPVEARPDSVRYRAVKFVRRNRTGVAVAGLVAVAILATLTAMWQIQKTAAASAKTELALMAASKQKEKIDGLTATIRDISNIFLNEVDGSLRSMNGTTEARELLVEHALQYLQGLATDAGEDPQLQRELAIAYTKVGDIRAGLRSANLGHRKGAMVAHQEALTIRQKLHFIEPADATLTMELAESYGRLGDLHRDLDPEAALTQYEQARDLLAGIGAAGSDDPEQRRSWATCLANIGDAFFRLEQTEDAGDAYRASLACREENARRWPGRVTQNELAVGCGKFAIDLEGRELYDEAIPWRRRAVEIRERLFEADPDDAVIRRGYWVAMWQLARLLLGTEPPQPSEALHLLDMAQPVLAPLAADENNARALRDLCWQVEVLGWAHLAAGNAAKAAAATQRLETSVETLEQKAPTHASLPDLRAGVERLRAAVEAPGQSSTSNP